MRKYGKCPNQAKRLEWKIRTYFHEHFWQISSYLIMLKGCYCWWWLTVLCRGKGDDKVYPMARSKRTHSEELTSEMMNKRRFSEVSSLATIQSGICRINPVTKTGQRLYMVKIITNFFRPWNCLIIKIPFSLLVSDIFQNRNMIKEDKYNKIHEHHIISIMYTLHFDGWGKR